MAAGRSSRTEHGGTEVLTPSRNTLTRAGSAGARDHPTPPTPPSTRRHRATIRSGGSQWNGPAAPASGTVVRRRHERTAKQPRAQEESNPLRPPRGACAAEQLIPSQLPRDPRLPITSTPFVSSPGHQVTRSARGETWAVAARVVAGVAAGSAGGWGLAVENETTEAARESNPHCARR